MGKNETERFLRFLGLCRRAGKTVHGTPLVCRALAEKKKPCLVILAADVSEATAKKVKNKCGFYGVSLLQTEATTEALAHAVGKTGVLAAVAVADENFAKELMRMNVYERTPPVSRRKGEEYAE